MSKFYLINTKEDQNDLIVQANNIKDAVSKIGKKDVIDITEIDDITPLQEGMVNIYVVTEQVIEEYEGEKIEELKSFNVLSSNIDVVIDHYLDRDIKNINKSADQYLFIS